MIVPFLIIVSIVSLTLFATLRRRYTRHTLINHFGLGIHDELPGDFPTHALSPLGEWAPTEVFVGFQGTDLLLTFDAQRITRFGSRNQYPTFTVVARRSYRADFPPKPPGDLFYRESGHWRIVIRYGFLGIGLRTLGPRAIADLWTQLGAQPPTSQTTP